MTNVIRHSRAKTCTLDFAADSGTMGVEILDDGPGAKSAGSGAEGSGLRGLRERFEVLGGTCEAGAGAHGGFALTARLPLRAEE